MIKNKTDDWFREFLIKDATLTGKYDFPSLRLTSSIATKAVPFDKANITTDKNQWVHFYTDDFRFERIWVNPHKYLEMLKKYKGIIGFQYIHKNALSNADLEYLSQQGAFCLVSK